jgi:ribosome-associated protein
LSDTTLCESLVEALEDVKGQNIRTLDVSEVTSITDHMVLVSGTSNRHVRSLVDEVIDAAKKYGEPPIGVEGRESYEWVLVDVGDVIVHVMQKEARGFYDLERLWSEVPVDSETRSPS